MNTSAELIRRDQKVMWHPFTQHGLEMTFLPVVSGKGATLHLDNGDTVLDAISSWWVNLHGHAHPMISEAIYQQAKKLEHAPFSSFTHEPAIELAEILINATQARNTTLSRCFYSDNGSTAVEIAMKMAYQYHLNCGVKTRTRFLAVNDSYHGDTLGSMAVSARGSYHQHFSALLPAVDFISSHDIARLEKYLTGSHEKYAALIIEPMVQAAGGMKMHSAEFLANVARLCKKTGVLFICDEVFTGFYRTGKCFAFEHANIKPDLLCLAKGLTGGFLPLAVTLATEEIFRAYQSNDMNQAFLHGHSYTANPLACAAAIRSWYILQETQTQSAIEKIAEKTKVWIARLSKHDNCANARSLGTIGAIEKRDLGDYLSGIGHKIRAFSIKQGVLLRPLGSVLYAVPPYCVTESELDQIYGTIEAILNKRDF